MCMTCGCGDPGHQHGTVRIEQGVETLAIEERLLAKNDEAAAHVRGVARRTPGDRTERDELPGCRQDLAAGEHDP